MPFNVRLTFRFQFSEFCSKFKSKWKRHCCWELCWCCCYCSCCLFVLLMPHDLFTINWIVTLLSMGLNRFIASSGSGRCAVHRTIALSARLIFMNQVKINWAFVKPITHHLEMRDYWLSILIWFYLIWTIHSMNEETLCNHFSCIFFLFHMQWKQSNFPRIALAAAYC